jgi:hypothetical protein
VENERLVTGLAVAFASMAALMIGLAAVFGDPVPLFAAGLFAVATYLFWYHASGRLAAGIYDRVERQARAGTEATGGRGGFGAGPREAWRRPGADGRRRRTGREQHGRAAGRDGGGRPGNAGRISTGKARSILDVGPGASQARIKQAYRSRVKEVHPDRPTGDRAEFKRVTEAYELLVDD